MPALDNIRPGRNPRYLKKESALQQLDDELVASIMERAIYSPLAQLALRDLPMSQIATNFPELNTYAEAHTQPKRTLPEWTALKNRPYADGFDPDEPSITMSESVFMGSPDFQRDVYTHELKHLPYNLDYEEQANLNDDLKYGMSARMRDLAKERTEKYPRFQDMAIKSISTANERAIAELGNGYISPPPDPKDYKPSQKLVSALAALEARNNPQPEPKTAWEAMKEILFMSSASASSKASPNQMVP
jgi:hypothetical protein